MVNNMGTAWARHATCESALSGVDPIVIRADSLLFPLGAPVKLCHTPMGVKGTVAIDLPHPEQLPRLQGCWRKNPGWI
jgi:hypothetical protein